MKRTLGYLKPYSKSVTAGLITKFIGSLAELFLPLLLQYIIDDVVPTKNLTNVILLGLAMLGFSLIALFGNIIANRLSAKSAGEMTHDLRYDLFSKTSYLKSGQVDEITTPSLISRMTSDTYYVNQMVARSLRLGVRAPILLIGGLILTFTLDWRLALVLAATVPFVITAIVIITKKSVPCYFSIQSGNDTLVRSLQENISGIRVVKALSKQEQEEEKFHSISEQLAAAELRANKIMSLTNPLVTLILNMGLVAVIAAGALLSAEAGIVLAFLSYFTIILNAMLGLSKIFVVLSRGVASADRVEKVLALDSEQKVGDYPPSNGDYAVEFKDVCFSYNGVEDNISDVSFALKQGQTLGVIGATGSGKSTLVNLLMRFYDVGGGAVYVGGKDVRSIPTEQLRKRFGAVFQNDFLMASGIRENIAYGRKISDEKILSALDCAQAKEFVDGLEAGINYNLAQKANNLSGGQKQRLLIARALAGDPEILVLDDCSSALDYATDARLRQKLSGEYPSTTKIIIAQRISSVKTSDQIIVMDDGKILGSGTHEQLLKTCDEYRSIYKAQMGEEAI